MRYAGTYHQTPSSLVWGARCAGWHTAGLFDSDSIDGLDEFHAAGARLQVRTSVGMEFPVFARDLMNAMHGQAPQPGRLLMGGVGSPYRRLGRPEEDFLKRRQLAAVWDPDCTIPPAAAGVPDIKTAVRFVLGAGAIPCLVWSDLQQMGEPLFLHILETVMREGVAALALRLSLPAGLSRAHLHFVLETAQRLQLPVALGMDLSAAPLFNTHWWSHPDLKPYHELFFQSALLIHGHTVLQRGDAIGYTSVWARKHFRERAERNLFYQQIGQWVRPERLCQWSDIPPNMTPSEIVSLAQRHTQEESVR